MAKGIGVGTHVRVRLERLENGSRAQTGNTDLPLTECVVSQVGAIVEGCFSLNYLDGHPVGIPFFPEAIEEVVALNAETEVGYDADQAADERAMAARTWDN